MRRFFLICLLVLFISSCSTSNIGDSSLNKSGVVKSNEIVENLTRIVAFGDSLTEGYGVEREDAYPSQLEKELYTLGYDVKVFNSGYSGETTTGALNRVDWVLSLNPDIVIITIGANDAMRGINLSITKKNIANIIEKFKKENVTIILSGMKIFENLGDSYVQEFEQIYPQLADEYGVEFIELFLAGVEADPKLNNEDQIHPNKEGYSIIVKNNILPKLIPLLEK